MSAPAHRPTPWGKVRGCSCRECSEARTRADNHWARLTIGGLALGAVLIRIVDAIIGGPGFLSIFFGA